MPDRLYFTDSDESNAMIASDPLALLVGFALDQQITVQKAFSGPLALKERLGGFDAATLASADLEPVFREKPAIHRYPGSMSRRVHALAVYVRDHYDGDAARVWTDAANATELRANLADLPGFASPWAGQVLGLGQGDDVVGDPGQAPAWCTRRRGRPPGTPHGQARGVGGTAAPWQDVVGAGAVVAEATPARTGRRRRLPR